ncbi:MAG TPA: hypothetical protein PK990_10155 [Salinivirgaceae bacterium]|nr:hypothetical protein [Salinivirgaceae bacterium]
MSPRFLILYLFIIFGTVVYAQHSYPAGESNSDTLSLRLIQLIKNREKEPIQQILLRSDVHQLSPREQFFLHFWVGDYPEALSIFILHKLNISDRIESHESPLINKVIEVFVSEQKSIDRLIDSQVADEDSALFLKISYRAAIESVKSNFFNNSLELLVQQYRLWFPQGKFIAYVNQFFPNTSTESGQYGYSTALGVGGIITSHRYSDFFKDRWNLRFDFDYYYRNVSFGLNAENHYTRLNSDITVNDTSLWKKQSLANQVRIGINGGFRRPIFSKTKGLLRGGVMYGWIFPSGTDIRQQNLPEHFTIKTYGVQTSVLVAHIFKERVKQLASSAFQNRVGYGIFIQYQFSVAWFNHIINSPVLFNGFTMGFYIDSFNQ